MSNKTFTKRKVGARKTNRHPYATSKRAKLNCWRDWRVGLAPFKAASAAIASLNSRDVETWDNSSETLAYALKYLTLALNHAEGHERMDKRELYFTLSLLVAYIKEAIELLLRAERARKLRMFAQASLPTLPRNA